MWYENLILNLIPNLALFAVSFWLVAFAVPLMVVFLLVAAWTERVLPYRRRLAFSLFVGMWLPFVLGIIGIGLFFMDLPIFRHFLEDASLATAIVPCVLVFLLGMGWGWWRYRHR